MKDKTNFSFIKVLKSGISSIQDSGRFGYLSEGIPNSGFMDSSSAGLANLLVGNSVNSACIEWSMLPPKLQFNESAIIAITGAISKIYVNNTEVKSHKSILIPEKAILSFGAVKRGVYGYISVKGGIKTSKVLGSRSWFKEVTEYQFLFKGLEIPFLKNTDIATTNVRLLNTLDKEVSEVLKVYPGPEFNFLSENQKTFLQQENFNSSSVRNRMGIQLGISFYKHEFSILSSPVIPGTVQWTPSGKLIVLMRDAQTIGGYPRLLQLTSESIDKISQLNCDFNFVLNE